MDIIHKDEVQVVIPIFPGFDLLDVVGPYAILHSTDGVRPIIASEDGCGMASWQGPVLEAEAALADVTGSAVVCAPGGSGPQFLQQIDHHAPVPQWIAQNMATFQWVCSVCTGAFVLAAAGALDGYTVTTHWMFQHEITLFPGVKLASGFPRYWVDGNRITGGGVSSGMDAALAMAAIFSSPDAAMKSQLMNQYAPNPPYQSGTPDAAPPQVLGLAFAHNHNPGKDMRIAVAKCLEGWKL